MKEQFGETESLRQENKNLIDFQDNIPVGIFQTALDGRFLYVNNTSVKMFGYADREEMMSARVTDVYSEPAQRESLIKELMEEGQIIDKQFIARRKDGSFFWSVLNVKTLFDTQGNVVRYDGVIQDITERMEVQLKLENANQEIIRINENLEKRIRIELKKRQKQQRLLIQKSKLESLGKLAAGIAHEINQPLGVLALSLENLHDKILRKEADDDYLNQKFRSIQEKIERIRNIITHVRLFSRDQPSVVFEKVDVNKTIQNALSMIKVQYETHGIGLVTLYGENLGITIGSMNKLEQVILNLLSNSKYAVERMAELSGGFSYSKKITIRTFCDEYYIYIEIEDNGTGIGGNIMNKIFDPFFTTKEEGRGTGLGLSIVYGIIKEMKGDVRIKSKKEKYTVVTLSLPRFTEKN
ncbi:MAG: PAS domain S-box protein [Bacteroidales bacterium]|nr:PAS domain S-box protein [Bacteroidales bacterium]